jgi:hypothetical protein
MLSRIVPTIEAAIIKPIGTKTVTLSGRQVSVPREPINPQLGERECPDPEDGDEQRRPQHDLSGGVTSRTGSICI